MPGGKQLMLFEQDSDLLPRTLYSVLKTVTLLIANRPIQSGQ
jgi:hypothetical protein